MKPTESYEQLVKRFQKRIPELSNYETLKREVKFGESRIDFCLENSKEKHYVEVKNVTLKENSSALFPDAVSDRGLKHLMELSQKVFVTIKLILLVI